MLSSIQRKLLLSVSLGTALGITLGLLVMHA